MGSSVVAVLFVFVLLGVVLVWTRRTTGGTTPGLSLRVVDAVNLGSGRTVAVIRSGDRFFLLGTTIHSISVIAELGPDDVSAFQQPEKRQGLPLMPAVSSFLKSLRNAP